MAAEPWNKVNIVFPGAVSSVRIHISAAIDENVDRLLLENDKVLTLLRSQVLQTEVRLLYELLYVLHYSSGSNRTFRALKQVEQCINRLKDMKLDAALQDLMDLCPTKFQRELSLKGTECDVPSQPMLEWLCLKVLGAARLMSCTMTHCSRAFILSKQTLKWQEFIILNVVITSMLSRLWVFFRGILSSLAPLYTQILPLLREVSRARPMPYLTDYRLPGDVVEFLGPSEETSSLVAGPAGPGWMQIRKNKEMLKMAKEKEDRMRRKRQEEQDIGVAVKRGRIFDVIHEKKALLKVSKDFTEESSEQDDSSTRDVRQKEMFHRQVKVAASFTDLAGRLESMISWCRSHRLRRKARLLSFVQLKCRKMKRLESAGFSSKENVQRKLRSFKQEACWASSPTRTVPSSFLSVSALWRRAYTRTRFLCLRERFGRHKTARVLLAESSPCISKGKRIELPVSEKPTRRTQVDQNVEAERAGENVTLSKITLLDSLADSSHDEIDDIFASVGF